MDTEYKYRWAATKWKWETFEISFFLHAVTSENQKNFCAGLTNFSRLISVSANTRIYLHTVHISVYPLAEENTITTIGGFEVIWSCMKNRIQEKNGEL